MTLFKQASTSVTNPAIYKCAENMVRVNNCQIGYSECPAEIISVRLDDGCIVRTYVYYDSGSQHSLTNRAIHPLVLSKRTTTYPIQLSTVVGSSSLNRQIVLVKLGHNLQIEAILVNDLNVFSYNMAIPTEWNKYKSDWCDSISDNHNVDAQLLVGSDKAIYHPRDALDKRGKVIETSSARLKVSVLSGKYLAHGHCHGQSATVATERQITPPPAVTTFTAAIDLPISDEEESNTTQLAEVVIHCGEEDVESQHTEPDEIEVITIVSSEDEVDPDEMDVITIVNSEDEVEVYTASVAMQL